MSTDFDFECHTCKRAVHAGQRMALNSYSFGYGSGDTAGSKFVAEWAMRCAAERHDVRLVVAQDTPEDFARDHEPGADGGD